MEKIRTDEENSELKGLIDTQYSEDIPCCEDDMMNPIFVEHKISIDRIHTDRVCDFENFRDHFSKV